MAISPDQAWRGGPAWRGRASAPNWDSDTVPLCVKALSADLLAGAAEVPNPRVLSAFSDFCGLSDTSVPKDRCSICPDVEGAVGSYSFHYIADGKVTKTEEKCVPGDLDAIDLAEKLSSESDIIVWSGYRWVARVKRAMRRQA